MTETSVVLLAISGVVLVAVNAYMFAARFKDSDTSDEGFEINVIGVFCAGCNAFSDGGHDADTLPVGWKMYRPQEDAVALFCADCEGPR